MLPFPCPQVELKYAVDDLAWIEAGKSDRLKRYKGCWGQIIAIEHDFYSVMIGTSIVKRVEETQLRLIQGADTEKAKKYLWNAMRLKFTSFSLCELQYLIEPSITTVEWLKIS